MKLGLVAVPGRAHECVDQRRRTADADDHQDGLDEREQRMKLDIVGAPRRVDECADQLICTGSIEHDDGIDERKHAAQAVPSRNVHATIAAHAVHERREHPRGAAHAE